MLIGCPERFEKMSLQISIDGTINVINIPDDNNNVSYSSDIEWVLVQVKNKTKTSWS